MNNVFNVLSSVKYQNLPESLLKITWEERHLKELKKQILQDTSFVVKLNSNADFQDFFNLLFDNKDYKKQLLNILNHRFNIFDNHLKVVEDALNNAWQNRNSLVFTTSPSSTGINLQNANSKVQTLVQQLKALNLPIPNDLLDSVQKSVKQGVDQEMEKQKRDAFFNSFFKDLQPFNQTNLKTFLINQEMWANVQLQNWFLNNQFSSSVINLPNDFLSQNAQIYTSFLFESVRYSLQSLKNDLPSINKKNFIIAFENEVSSKLNNLNSNISQAIKRFIYNPLENEVKKVEKYFLDILYNENIILNEEYKFWKSNFNAGAFINYINTSLQSKIDFPYEIEVEKIDKATRFDLVDRKLSFKIINPQIKKTYQDIKVSSSFIFSLIVGNFLLDQAQNSFEYFKVDANFQNLRINNLNDFLHFNNKTWNSEWNFQLNNLKLRNSHLDFKLDNFQEFTNEVRVDLILEHQLKFFELRRTLTFKKEKKIPSFVLDEKSQEQNLKDFLEQQHNIFKRKFKEAIPEKLFFTNEAQKIYKQFNDEVDLLKEEQIRDIEQQIDFSLIKNKDDLLKVIEELKSRFEKQLENFSLSHIEGLSKIIQVEKIINELSQYLDEDLFSNYDLVEEILKNPSVYEKILNSEIVKNKDWLRKILDILKKTPFLSDFIKSSNSIDFLVNSLNSASENYKYIYFGAGAFLGTVGLTGVGFSARSFSVNKKLATLKNTKMKKAGLKTASLFTIFTSLVSIGASIVLIVIFFVLQGGF